MGVLEVKSLRYFQIIRADIGSSLLSNCRWNVAVRLISVCIGFGLADAKYKCLLS